ncbi:MAG TPA: hypothetical protein VGN49_02475 [Micrococcaceae bacterium]|jgi:hypothetical protein|nr:hypothetical protein [Micrococcaceae bacterium]
MQALWIVLTVLAAAVLGWPVTAGILRLAKTADVREAGGAHERAPAALQRVGASESAAFPAPDASLETVPAAAPTGTSELTNPTVLRGGLVIGILERTAVVVAILADQPVAIAYIVAIKGLGRYPELKQTPAASERFIIGTLGSMLWAAGLATLAKWLLLG